MESKNKDFWLIVIQEKEIIVGLVSRPDDKLQVRGIGEKQLWSGTDEKELISAVDMSLSTCSEICHLTEDQEPDGATFILSPFWIDEKGEIISSKASLLKKLCTQFDFSPLGFIVDDEAIAQSSDHKDSISNSFILIHLSATEYRLSLIHLGNIKARAKYSYAQTLTPQDLEAAISSLKTGVTLPPQIIFWGKIPPTLEDQMLNYSRTGKRGSAGFLHFPQIKILDDQTLFSTFSQVVSREMNKINYTPSPSSKDTKEPVSDLEILPAEKTPPAPVDLDKTDFGFVSTDIAQFPAADHTPASVLPPGEPANVVTTAVSTQPSLLETQKPLPPPNEQPKKKFSPKFPKLKFPSLTFLSFFKKKPIFLVFLFVIPFIFLALAWYFLPQAAITLYIKPQPLEFKTNATFDPKASSVDPDQAIIPVKEISFSVTETQEISSTGQITIGEKARGEVKIQNRTDQRVTFPKGTAISTKSGLLFHLTSEISIASKIPDFESGIDQWGETKAMLEAVQIGDTHNLAPTTRLTVDDYPESQFVVTVTESFTGGYAETVQAVSKDDHQTLKNLLVSTLEEKLPQILPDKISPQDILLPDFTKTNIEDIEYLREIGEKSQSVSATATLNITLWLVTRPTQQQVIQAFLVPTMPSDSVVNPDTIAITVVGDKISITANAAPQFDKEAIKSDLLGLSESKADALLRSLPRVYRYTAPISPELPSVIKTMPHTLRNITIDIQY